MRFIFTLLLVGLSFTSIFAEVSIKKTQFSFYGFIRNDFYLNTYQGMSATNDYSYLYPNYIGKDADGNDINKQTSANLLSIITRVGVIIRGPDVLNAKMTGNIEADFSGKPEMYLFRLRKAFVQFDWEKTQLITGQTWHPFGGGNNIPYVTSLGLGSPFRPLNRSAQVKLNHRFGLFEASLSTVYQHQYTSYGPVGQTSLYKRNAAIPEIVGGISFINKGLLVGANMDFNSIQPREITSGTNGNVYKTDEILYSYSYMLFCKLEKNKFWFYWQGYYGQNVSHMNMNSGYGVKNYNSENGKEEYTNYNSVTSVLNIAYGVKWRPGIFIGYSKNLGTSDPLYQFSTNGKSEPRSWGLSPEIQSVYRISPSLSYTVDKLNLQFEYELTGADKGTGLFRFSDGLYSESHQSVNNGVKLVMIYNF
ncbi:MAG TPA: hypothetical protein VN249_14100 [Prolixibacteraceae bacterium]|nr:hypothetical protein [Prolixibacteraceae bacterium]